MDFDTQFTLMENMFWIMFVVVGGLILYVIIRGLSTWNKNNHSPRLTVDARLVTKRSAQSQHHTQNGTMATTTWYYATFEVESGDRMEFSVTGEEYGMLAEGDTGRLTFQGTRYLSFKRT